MVSSTSTIIIVIIYLVLVFGISIYANRHGGKTTKDFFVASNSLGSFVIFMTSMATAFSAFAFMGQIGQVYNFGGSAIFNFMSYGIISYPLFLLIGKKLWYFGKTFGYVTPADFVAHRYQSNGPSRVLIGLIIGVYFSIFYIVIQVQGMSWAIQEATGISTAVSTGIICVVLVTYISIGGIRGAAYVDVMQAGLMVCGSFIIAIVAIYKNGGIGPLYVAMDAVRPGAMIPKQNMLPMMTGSLVMALSMPIWPTLWVKYYSANNLKANSKVAAGCGLGTAAITVSLPLIIVAGIIIAYPAWEAALADRLVIRYVLDYTNPLIAAIIVGSLISAAMSTAAGLLLLISSVFTMDLPHVLPKEKREKISQETLLRFAKIISVVVVAICFFISLRPMGQLVSIGISLTYPGYLLALPIVVGGFYWKRANKQGMISGLVVGLLVIYYTTFISKNPLGIAGGMWGLVICSIVFVVVSMLTAPTDQHVLADFGLSDSIEKSKENYSIAVKQN